MLHKIYYAYLLQVNIKEGESKHQQDDLEGEKVSEVFVVCHFFFFDTLHDSFDWTIAYYCHFRTVLCGLGEVLKVKKMGTYFC